MSIDAMKRKQLSQFLTLILGVSNGMIGDKRENVINWIPTEVKRNFDCNVIIMSMY